MFVTDAYAFSFICETICPILTWSVNVNLSAMCVMSFLCFLVYSDASCLFCLIRSVLYCVGTFFFLLLFKVLFLV